MVEGEQNLIKRAQKGEKECFGELYHHYLPQIFRFIAVKVSHRQIAEDLSHDVFLSAWQNLDNYTPQGFPFSSWLYQIARNKVIDHYRTQKHHTSLENVDEEILKPIGSGEKNLDQALDFEKVKVAFAKLSPEQQEVMLMKFVEDLSYPEIATALDKSEGAIRLLQHRAIKALKEIIEEKENERG